MKAIAIIRKIDTETEGGPAKVAGVLFRTQDVPAKLSMKSVSLSRADGGCVFPITELSAHDGHAPPWFVKGGTEEQKDAARLPDYVGRVFGAIQEHCGYGAPKVSVVFPDSEPEPATGVVEAVQAALAKETDAAVVAEWGA